MPITLEDSELMENETREQNSTNNQYYLKARSMSQAIKIRRDLAVNNQRHKFLIHLQALLVKEQPVVLLI